MMRYSRGPRHTSPDALRHNGRVTVLLAYNDTPQGNAALGVAVGEASRRGTSLAVLCLTARDGDAAASDAEAARATAQLPPELSPPALLFRAPDQVPAEAILDAIESGGPDVVVLGARKRPDVGMFLLGTTTQRVLLDSSAPVLVVKAADDRSDGA
jgi:nucleotide-binding universal stress UspA family protein